MAIAVIRFFSACLLAVACGCGSDTVMSVAVDLTDFVVPDEVDLLYLEAADADGATIGHNFALAAGNTRPVVDLLEGSRLPHAFSLTAYAFKGAQLVASSAPTSVAFKQGETVSLTIKIPRSP